MKKTARKTRTTGSPRDREVMQLKRALSEAHEQQAATADVLKVIASSPADVQPVFNAILRSAVNLCSAEIAAVFPYDAKLVHLGATHNWSEEAKKYFSTIYPSSPSLTLMSGRTILSRAVVKLADAAADRHYDANSAATGHWRRMLGVPIMREDQPLGALVVCWREPGEAPQRQVDLLQTFADQAVIAIENVRLFKELEARNAEVTESLEQQTATADILKVISGSPADIQPVFDAVAESAARLCGAHDVVIRLVEGNEHRVVAHHGPIPIRPPYVVTRATMVGRAIVEARTVHIPDVTEAHVKEEYPESRSDAAGRRTLLAVPMVREGRAIGVVLMRRQELRPFTDKQIKLLETFAAQAVIAIENVRLFNETKEALEQQTATAEVLKVISSSPTDIQPVFDAILENATRLCDAHMANLGLYGGDTYLPVAQRGGSAEYAQWVMNRGPYRPVAGGDMARMLAEGLPIHVVDLRDSTVYRERSDPNRIALVELGGARTAVIVPMLKEGRIVGGITVYRPEARPFSQKQIDLVCTFANQAVIAIENVRLVNETKEALEQQTVISGILRAISGSPTETQPVFDAIVKSGVHLFGGMNMTLRLVKGDRVGTVASTQSTSEAFVAPLDDGRSASSRAMLRREVVQIPDIQAAEEWVGDGLKQRAAQRGWRAILDAPLLRENSAIGTISVTRSTPGPFTDKQIALLQTFADQAVIAIENVRLFKELQARNAEVTESLEQQTATAEILRVISSSPTNIQPVLDAVAESAARLCAAPDCVIRLLDGKTHSAVAHHGPIVPVGPGTLDRGMGVGRALRERRTIQIHDAQAEVPGSMRVPTDVRTILAVPLLREREPIGAIVLRRMEVSPFSDSHIKLLETFADQAVIAIENVRLFKELQARNADITESLSQQTATAEVLQVISRSTFDLKPVLETLVENAQRLCDATMGLFFRLDGDVLRLEISHNANPDYVDYRQRHPIPVNEETITGRAALERRPVHVHDYVAYRQRHPIPVNEDTITGRIALEARPKHADDILGDPDYKGTPASQRTVLCMPVLREGSTVGVITVFRTEVKPFTDKQIALLQTFADQAAIAIENVRLFNEIQDKSRQLEVANKHKSEFLAHMSHELRTPLNAIIGFSEVLIERMFGETNPKQDEYLRDIHGSGQHLLSLINDILDLSKVEAGRMELELSDFHLPSALANAMTLVRERAQTHGIALELLLDDRLAEIRADERKVKQIVLNLLSNAVKFTPDGGRVKVDAHLADLSVEISVNDTGAGIAPEDQAALFEEFRQVGRDYARKQEGTGLGLVLTRRFVELHGGKIWLESASGEGSTFTFSLPLSRVN